METKRLPFCRLHFEIYFNENVWILIQISLKFVDSIEYNPALVTCFERTTSDYLNQWCVIRSRYLSRFRQQFWINNYAKLFPHNCVCWCPCMVKDEDVWHGWQLSSGIAVVLLCRMSGQCTCTLHPTWWRHEMKTLSVLLAHYEENQPVTGGSPHKGPITQLWSFLWC